MGTRIIDPQPLIFDHAAQFFTVRDSRFGQLVDGWIEGGLVREWCGPIGELEAGGHFKPMPSSPPRFIGVSGMRPLADSILSQVHTFCYIYVYFPPLLFTVFIMILYQLMKKGSADIHVEMK